MTIAVYEIKKGNRWIMVRATSMKALDTYCKNNGYSFWRMCSMMSRVETVASKSLKIVA